MPTFCSKCDPHATLCDFCKFYEYRGDEFGTYVNKGWCQKWKAPKDPDDGCGEFYCMNVDKEKSQ